MVLTSPRWLDGYSRLTSMALRTPFAAAVAFLSLLAGTPADGQTTDLLKREVAAVGVVERLGATVPPPARFADAGR